MSVTNLSKAAICLLGMTAFASAGGINCEGSSECGASGFHNAMGNIQTTMQAAISAGSGNLNYPEGRTSPSQPSIPLSRSASPTMLINRTGQIACDCNGNPGGIDPSAGICAFFQNGASGNLQTASNLVAELQQHNCVNCGSVATTDGGDISNGELTVNYVDNPGCCTAGEGGAHVCEGEA